MKNIAIIPARGGSKRIPKKNIKEFLGKPIICYSIDAAKRTGLFDDIIVSTDSLEISEIAIDNGASVPFMRSSKNSDDYATLTDVIKEVLDYYEKENHSYDNFCCILPTAPFLSPIFLKEAFELLHTKDADSVISVTEFDFPIQRAFKHKNGQLKMLHPEYMNSRSQDLENTYHDAGQFYWMRVNEFLIQNKLFSNITIPYVLDKLYVHDIDTPEDWVIAEVKYRIIKKIDMNNDQEYIR